MLDNHNIAANTKGVFKISLAIWQCFKGKKAITLYLKGKDESTGKVTLFYKDGYGNLSYGYYQLQSIMTVLKLSSLSKMVGDNNAIICPELNNQSIGLYLHKDDYFAPSYNKVYENLAVTAVYDSVSNNLADDMSYGNKTPKERHDYFYQLMLNKTRENQANILASIEQAKCS